MIVITCGLVTSYAAYATITPDCDVVVGFEVLRQKCSDLIVGIERSYLLNVQLITSTRFSTSFGRLVGWCINIDELTLVI